MSEALPTSPADPVVEAEAALKTEIAAQATATATAAAQAALETAWPGLVGKWLAANVANTPIAQSTPAFNHLVNEALPALRQAILEIL